MILTLKNLTSLFDNICDFQIPYGLNSDEDIILESLKMGLKNIFIPNVLYKSNYEYNFITTRSFGMHSKNRDNVKKIFIDKWGFDMPIKMDLDEKIATIKKAKKLHGNDIVWSSNFYSYDYQFYN